MKHSFRPKPLLAVLWTAFALQAPLVYAADITITPPSGSNVVISGGVVMPGLPNAAQNPNLMCFDSSGVLGRCTSAAGQGPTGATGPAGPTGATGSTGPQGAQGLQGVAGTDGKTVIAGKAVLNGTVPPVDNVTGTDGDFYINTVSNMLYGPRASGIWPAGAVNMIGPTGATGSQGSAGATGATGAAGTTGSIGATGPQGPQGIQGIAGTDGKTVIAGKAVLNGAINPTAGVGADGDFYINTTSNILFGPKASGTWPVGSVNMVGPAGATGAQGTAGATGAAGSAGAVGAQGIQGIAGINGAAGAAGAQGIQGVAGNTGAAGANGSNGINGLDGKTLLSGIVPPSAGVGADGDYYIDSVANISYGPKAAGAWPAGVSIVGPQGLQGVQGIQGTQGVKGDTGNTGNTGLTGTAGTNGAAGANGSNGLDGKTVLSGAVDPVDATNGVNGDFYINTTSNKIFGPKVSGAWPAGVLMVGPQGIQGTQGTQGNQGVQGIQGIKGDTGNTGNTGNTGLTGTAGTNGAVGAAGPAGASPFSLNGSDAVYTAGSVGIGTTNPGAPLSFADSIATKIQFNGNNVNTYTVGLSSPLNGGDALMKFVAGGKADGTLAGEFGFYNGTNASLLINKYGNVGIGTIGPNYPLQISKTIASNTTNQTMLALTGNYGSATGAGFGVGINFGGTMAGNILIEDAASIYGYNSDVQDNGFALGFATRPNVATNPVERLTILRSGNVGIGTTAPEAELHLKGDAQVNAGAQIKFEDTYTTTGKKYILGSGTGASGSFGLYDVDNAATRFIVNSTGNVGIGTTTPAADLQIGVHFNTMPANTGLALWSGKAIRFINTDGNANEGGYLKGNISNGLILGGRVTAVDYDVLTISGNNAAKPLQVVGGAFVTSGGVWTDASDARLKRDIQPMTTYGLNTVMQLNPVTYFYNADTTNHPEVGFIAQEVQKIIPEVVSGTEGDLAKGETLGLSYGHLVPVLTKAIQELKAENDGLKAENSDLKARLLKIKKALGL